MIRIIKRAFNLLTAERVILLSILLLFYVNTFHTQFPDEFDNIFGGFLIDRGKLPYTGFFTHHNPGAYFLASFITIFTQRSFVNFRIVFSILLFAYFLFSYVFLKRRLKAKRLDYFLLYGILTGIGATYWWGHMLLSETIAGFLLVPVVLLMVEKKVRRIIFERTDIWFISLSAFFCLFTSLTYIYLIPVIILIALYYYLIDKRRHFIRELLWILYAFSLPYGLFAFYLLITGGFREFYFASIYYNMEYYIYNFPKVAGIYSHHPLRYAISIARNTLDSIFLLLAMLRDFNLSYPLNVTLGLSSAVIFIYFLLRKHFTLAVLILACIFYTNARSEPLNIRETDFHATVFIMFTIALSSYLFYRLKDELNGKIAYFEKYVLTAVFTVTYFYWFFTGIHLTSKFIDKTYNKFMGNEPRIYDMPQAAPVMNKILSPDDYYWIGPFELQELLFIKGNVASKYFWYLPASSRDEKIRKELAYDLGKNRPKVIVFKKWWANFGVKPEDFNTVIVDFLDENYFNFQDLNKQGEKYKAKVARERDFDFETEFFFDKEREEEIVKLLLDKGMIEKI